MRIRQSLLQPYTLLQEFGSPGRCSSWELEFRDCGANPGPGLLLILERLTEGMLGGGVRGGNAGGRKPGSHGSKAILLSQVYRVESSL